jgi:hypothetical protein
MKPPDDSVPAGATHHGKQLFKRTMLMNKPEPDIDPATGEQRWKTDRRTGERITAIRKPKIVKVEKLFYLEDQGNGHVEMVDYAFPTEAELAAQERKKKIEAMGGGRIAELLVDHGLSAEDAVERLARLSVDSMVDDSVDIGQQMLEQVDALSMPDEIVHVGNIPDGVPTVVESSPEQEPEVEYPIPAPGVGRWEHSDGTISKGKKAEAIEREKEIAAEVAEAKTRAAMTPDY